MQLGQTHSRLLNAQSTPCCRRCPQMLRQIRSHCAARCLSNGQLVLFCIRAVKQSLLLQAAHLPNQFIFFAHRSTRRSILVTTSHTPGQPCEGSRFSLGDRRPTVASVNYYKVCRFFFTSPSIAQLVPSFRLMPD